jgi:rRNA maturation endonuclease Nob1
MSLIITFLLGGFLIYYIVKPLFDKNEAAFAEAYTGNNHFDELIKNKNVLLQEIKEIDFEYQMGKLSEQDYKNLKGDFENQAIDVLQKIDNKGNGKSSKDDVELEIEIYKKRQKKSKTQHSFKFCSNCGNKIQPHDKFCSSCGKNLK